MKILHLSPSANSSNSAAHRIHESILGVGEDSRALVYTGSAVPQSYKIKTHYPYSYLKKRIFDRLNNILAKSMYASKKNSLPWSNPRYKVKISNIINKLDPDIVNLHWLADSSVDLRDLALNCKSTQFVWTLHDVWPITGGCHCNLDCSNWRVGCNDCPQIGGGVNEKNNVHRYFNDKKEDIELIKNLTVVAPSKWLQKNAAESPVFSSRKVVNIPNPINTHIYSPLLNNESNYGLNSHDFIVSYGASGLESSPHKGFVFFKELVKIFKESDRVKFLVFGGRNSSPISHENNVLWLGEVRDHAVLREILSSSDLFLSTSLQDNFSSLLLEASSMGLPSIAFDIGGNSDIVRDNESGFLVQSGNVEELARKIKYLRDNKCKAAGFGESARIYTVGSFSYDVVSLEYVNLYRQVLNE
ncbi:MAG: hypothetical protein COW01_03610 [Bdellovibrionales bacterium CG12_big_fil_rev_8_21_14_0_65_38_15]|nr:MAG: hypothetical protein COW01_03610 [Bdellovibrionales bacterium CG12_big_fil_rev_8_21_14_0_65_38_15]